MQSFSISLIQKLFWSQFSLDDINSTTDLVECAEMSIHACSRFSSGGSSAAEVVSR